MLLYFGSSTGLEVAVLALNGFVMNRKSFLFSAVQEGRNLAKVSLFLFNARLFIRRRVWFAIDW